LQLFGKQDPSFVATRLSAVDRYVCRSQTIVDLLDTKSLFAYLGEQVLEARVAVLSDSLLSEAGSTAINDPVERVKAHADKAISARYKWVRAALQSLFNLTWQCLTV
jgi:hypothetical protein